MRKILSICVAIAMVMITASTFVGADEPTVNHNEAWYNPSSTEITTTTTVSGTPPGDTGGDSLPPIIKCKWEYDLTPLQGGHPGYVPTGQYVHDADPLVDGLQVAPTLGGNVKVGYYAVVTDPEGVGQVAKVYADIWHPDGTFKYQIELTKVTYDEALNLWYHMDPTDPTEDDHLDLLTINEDYFGIGNEEAALLDIEDQLVEELAYLYYGEAYISYCQPGGYYYVGIRARDSYSAWSAYLFNQFWYIPTAAVEVDFNSIAYGSVAESTNKWIGGDDDMTTPTKPTVKNIGNTPVELYIWQDDMGFEHTGQSLPGGSDPDAYWNVEFDARLTALGTPAVYDPYEVSEGYLGYRIPGTLMYCTQDKLDFSIHVLKGFPGVTYEGDMKLYAYTVGYPPDPWWKTPDGTAPWDAEPNIHDFVGNAQTGVPQTCPTPPYP